MQAEIPGNTDKTAKISGAVRSLFLIYNNSRVYNIDHPVFHRTVDEHIPIIQTALKDNKELFLSFIKGQIRCGPILLDPGSSMFKTVAQTFEEIGVSGLCLYPDVTAEEIIKLVKIMTINADEIKESGLQKILDREGIKHIIEKKVRLDIDGTVKSDTVPEKSKRAPVTEKEKNQPPVSSQISHSPSTIFEIDDSDTDLGTIFAETTAEPTEEPDEKADRKKPFNEFVTGTLSELLWKRKSVSEVSKMISREFDQRLDEKTEELRKEKKTVIRHLENVKSVVFQKLETMNVMALLIDTNLNVLAMTSSAETLLGKLTKIPKDSPLTQCTRQEEAFQEITLKGTKLIVQAIASETLETGESIILITLE